MTHGTINLSLCIRARDGASSLKLLKNMVQVLRVHFRGIRNPIYLLLVLHVNQVKLEKV
jgi:hypothetical protein